MGACSVKLLAGFSLMLVGLQGVLSAIQCEELPAETCAFSVSSSGVRCVLEKYNMDDVVQYKCLSSAVTTERAKEWIETEECMSACGLERMWVGMSSDSLLEPDFATKLCSDECQNGCPNVVDLYVNLAAGEGIFLSRLCMAERSRSRRQLNSKEVMLSPESSATVDYFGGRLGVPMPATSPVTL